MASPIRGPAGNVEFLLSAPVRGVAAASIDVQERSPREREVAA